MKKFLFVLALTLCCSSLFAQSLNANESNFSSDIINNPDESVKASFPPTLKKVPASIEKKLLGKHKFSLQWISWDYFGSVNISKLAESTYRCVGKQLSKENDDYIYIDGKLEVINAQELLFNGSIRTKIHHINGGKEYEKNGTHLFKATKGRKYWRMQDMEDPDGSTDYVDIFFK